MWNAPLHDKDFVQEVLTHSKECKASYGTAARMEGMLTMAKEVRPNLNSSSKIRPFIILLNKLKSFPKKSLHVGA